MSSRAEHQYKLAHSKLAICTAVCLMTWHSISFGKNGSLRERHKDPCSPLLLFRMASVYLMWPCTK